MELEDRVALVTGGVSGVGLGIASALLSVGMKVVVTYRSDRHVSDALEHLNSIPSARVHAVRLDVTDRKAFAAAADEAEGVFGKVHVLCNNAGVILFGPADVATAEDWDWVMGVNFRGVVNGVMTLVPRMKAHGEGGHIVNVASMSAFVPTPRAALYCASKFAVRGFTECLRYNLAPFNIGVSLFCPGLVRTHLHESMAGRPANLANTGYPMSQEMLGNLGRVFAIGMDPQQAGEKAVAGIQRNGRYIFSHPEFKDELRQLSEEIIAAFPDDAVNPQRAAFEEARRTENELMRRKFRL
jgi:NAD(P)-dependent dehydrogenase (short-subunit alcohol dehydrogenase family)